MARERPPRRCSGAAEEKRRLRRPPFSSRATGGPAPARHTQPRARYQPPRSQRARPAAASSGSAWGASAAAARTVGTDMPPPPRPAACRAAARATRRVPRCTRAWLSVCVCAAVCGREAAWMRAGGRASVRQAAAGCGGALKNCLIALGPWDPRAGCGWKGYPAPLLHAAALRAANTPSMVAACRVAACNGVAAGRRSQPAQSWHFGGHGARAKRRRDGAAVAARVRVTSDEGTGATGDLAFRTRSDEGCPVKEAATSVEFLTPYYRPLCRCLAALARVQGVRGHSTSIA